VMDLHRPCIDVRFERIEGIGKIRDGIRHLVRSPLDR
jgi:hypothetical protein